MTLRECDDLLTIDQRERIEGDHYAAIRLSREVLNRPLDVGFALPRPIDDRQPQGLGFAHQTVEQRLRGHARLAAPDIQDPVDARRQVTQHPQPLAYQFVFVGCEPRDVANRPRERAHDGFRRRVDQHDEDDRDFGRRLSRRRYVRALGEQNIYVQANQLGGVGRHSTGIGLAPANDNVQILATAPATLFQLGEKGIDARDFPRIRLRRTHEHADPPHRLLRGGRHGPRRQRTANRLDEIAPLHLPPPKPGSIAILAPTALHPITIDGRRFTRHRLTSSTLRLYGPPP